MTSRERNSLTALWWVALAVALGPVWTIQRDIWDGVIGAYGLDRRVYDGIHDWLVPGNWGLMYLIIRGVGGLSDLLHVAPWVLFKLLLTASVIGLSLEARLLGASLLRWDDRSSRVLGILTLAFPCWYLLYGSTFVYVVFIWWVFLGHRWMHSPSRVRAAAGYVVLLASFQVNSNFVMAIALEAAHWACRDRQTHWRWGRSLLVAGSAVVVYLTLRLMFPPSGLYAGYNNLILPTSREGIVAWVRAGLMFATWIPLVGLPAMMGLALMRIHPNRQPQPEAGKSLAVASLLFVSALFAYLAVGKGAPLFVVNLPLEWLGAARHLGREAGDWFFTTVDGWSTRHTFLLSLPAAVVSASLLRTVAASGSRNWWISIGVAIAANLGWMAHGHAAKLLRFAQEEAVVRGLRVHPAPEPGKVDLVLTPRPAWNTWTYESNYWMWLAYRQSTWAVASVPLTNVQGDAAWRDREDAVSAGAASRDYYLMSDYRPGVCVTRWRVDLPQGLHGASVWLDRLGVQTIPPAGITDLGPACPP